MALTEQQLGRLAAFRAELGEHPSEELLRDAKQALRDQAPELYQVVFGDGHMRGQEKWEKRAKAAEAELARRAVPADQELTHRQELAELRASIERERRERARSEALRALEALSIDHDWGEVEVTRALEQGRLTVTAAGEIEVEGIEPEKGESPLAAYARHVLRNVVPPKFVAAHSDTGSDTGGDRAGGGKSKAGEIMDKLQAARDARPNPLLPQPQQAQGGPARRAVRERADHRPCHGRAAAAAGAAAGEAGAAAAGVKHTNAVSGGLTAFTETEVLEEGATSMSNLVSGTSPRQAAPMLVPVGSRP